MATLAEAIMQDAWNYFSSGGSSAPADKVAIFGIDDIYRLSEVSRLESEEACPLRLFCFITCIHVYASSLGNS